ncbi:hypothetical protein L915_05520 [Phytophthora nicotianae]|uniref:Uncharacterized protein n=1 Tax=Phytophthora nicotianae TaxID=4792 RepID=W2NS45_PHYNI|nr:hypothetical protein L915_05520 [Phytophthora nicotianae]ETM50499.1 hypothetical protein L914_05468 [Phytophthora nicotianae]
MGNDSTLLRGNALVKYGSRVRFKIAGVRYNADERITRNTKRATPTRGPGNDFLLLFYV